MSRLTDLQSLVKGLGKIGSCSYNVTQREVSQIWENSYIKPVAQQAIKIVFDSQNPSNITQNQSKAIPVSQALENLPLVLEGIQIYASAVAGLPSPLFRKGRTSVVEDVSKNKVDIGGRTFIFEIDRDVTALDLLDLDLTNEKVLRGKIFQKIEVEEDVQVPVINTVEETVVKDSSELRKSMKISSAAKERSVPSTRIARVANFASLGVGLGLGVVAEASRRAVGIGKKSSSEAKLDGSLILNEANAERIVATLCRVRGAALKMGQILSIQDGAVIGPELQRIFDRVRESADFMPLWQLEKVMRAELGSDWREKFQEFQNEPFAAASIGQVHQAVLLDGSDVAVKVQYPGVAKSIDSDIRNLMSLISVMAFLPEGLFIDNIAKHMKIELAQECDYIREAKCGDTMGRILAHYPEYHVPAVRLELCSTQVLTTQYITDRQTDNMVIVVTGFGLFRDYEVNASWEAVKGLPELWTDKDNNLIIEEIPVEYDFIQKQVPEKWEYKNPEFVVHVGVSSLAKKVTLELQAHNDGYDKPDVKSCYPQENCCLPCGSSVEKTCLDLDKICNNVNLTSEELSLGVEACLSEDAGRYLCDFSYYKSLHKMKGKSLFIHVPPIDQPYTTLQLSKTIKIVLQNIIQQIKP